MEISCSFIIATIFSRKRRNKAKFCNIWFYFVCAFQQIEMFIFKIFIIEHFKHIQKYRDQYKEPPCSYHPPSTIISTWLILLHPPNHHWNI